MASKNALWQMDEVERGADRRRTELELLKEKLQLGRVPRRMECIDISNLQGKAIVASNVCFIDGKPAKEHYRHYIIKDIAEGPDDYGSMREAVRRRLTRAQRDNDAPDLLVIDGGKGQLSSALEVFADFPTLSLEIVSLAKSKPKRSKKAFITSENPERSFERVFFPGRESPTALAPGTPEYRLLTQVRDEAHRFAITHHRKRRSKISHGSEIETIPGIGPSMRQKLLKKFSSLEGIRTASLEQLKSISGLRDSSAVALHSYFRSQEENEETS